MTETKYDVSIVLATYNEEDSVAQELEIIKKAMDTSAYSYEVILIDDASTDQTAQIAKKYDWVKLIQHPSNKGSGGARKTGTQAAKGEIVIWTDIDGTYPNHQIPQLVSYLKQKNLDQVIGARRAEKGYFKFLRAPAKWFIRQLAMFLSGSSIPDLNSGLRAFKREIAGKYLYLLPSGFSCVSTITLAFLCNGYSVGYFPIEYYKRKGRSKFHPITDTNRYLTQVIRMIMYFNPLKIFLPVSILAIVGGLIMSLSDWLGQGTLEERDIILIISGILIGMMGLLADLIVTAQKR